LCLMNNSRQSRSFIDDVSIDSWQCQIEIDKVKSKKTKNEPITSHSTIKSESIASRSTNQIKRDKSSATFKLVVAFVFNKISIDSWQCQMEINNVKSQSIDSWQCYINKVDLKLLSLCSIHHSWQCRSDFDTTLSFVDQSSSAFQLVVASSNNNTLSFDDSVDRSSATIKLVVVSITIEYLKGSFKVSSGAFHQFNGAPAFTAELIVALTPEQSNHELTELNGFIVHYELIELIKGFVGHSKLIELINSLVHVGHIKLFKLSRLIVDSSSEGAQISKLIVDYILIPSSEGAQRAASKLIVESTIVFELAGVRPARIIFRNKPHKLIGEHFIAPSILCNTPHWLIVKNILLGARVIPNISCEEPHGLIVTSNAPSNFE
jgi:hypothetical protein